MIPVARRYVIAIMIAVVSLCCLKTMAQVPARFYWKTLSGSNGVPVVVQSIRGNTNPFDPARIVTPGANFDATVALAGYARMFSIYDRAAMVAVIEPMGRISGEVTVAGKTFNQIADGFGDPMVEFDINVIGSKAQKAIPNVCATTRAFLLIFWETLHFRLASTTAPSL